MVSQTTALLLLCLVVLESNFTFSLDVRVKRNNKRKGKPIVGQFFHDRWKRFLKTDVCSVDIRYSSRYNSYFWNRMQIPDHVNMNMTVSSACNVNGVHVQHCKYGPVVKEIETFRVDMRKLSKKLIQFSIYQDMTAIIAKSLYDTSPNVTSTREYIESGPTFKAVCWHCFVRYRELGKLDGDILEEKYRKEISFGHCLYV